MSIVIVLVVLPSSIVVVVIPINFIAELNPRSSAVIVTAELPLKFLLPTVSVACVLSAVPAVNAELAVAALPE